MLNESITISSSAFRSSEVVNSDSIMMLLFIFYSQFLIWVKVYEKSVTVVLSCYVKKSSLFVSKFSASVEKQPANSRITSMFGSI